jgi:hypothetical protein
MNFRSGDPVSFLSTKFTGLGFERMIRFGHVVGVDECGATALVKLGDENRVVRVSESKLRLRKGEVTA